MKMDCMYVNCLKLNPGELTLDFARAIALATKYNKHWQKKTTTTIAKKYFRDTRKCISVSVCFMYMRLCMYVYPPSMLQHVYKYIPANSTECFSSGKVSIQTGNEITIIMLTAHWRKIRRTLAQKEQYESNVCTRVCVRCEWCHIRKHSPNNVCLCTYVCCSVVLYNKFVNTCWYIKMWAIYATNTRVWCDTNLQINIWGLCHMYHIYCIIWWGIP